MTYTVMLSLHIELPRKEKKIYIQIGQGHFSKMFGRILDVRFRVV